MTYAAIRWKHFEHGIVNDKSAVLKVLPTPSSLRPVHSKGVKNRVNEQSNWLLRIWM